MNKEEAAVNRALEWVKDIAKPKNWKSYLSAMDYALAVSLSMKS